jgi:hypothetical protein
VTRKRLDLLQEGKVVGTKAIVPFLRRFMDLNDDKAKAWRTIKDWKKKYGLPIHEEINGQPSVIPSEVVTFFIATPEGLKEGVTKGEFRTMLEKRQ